MYFFNNSFRSLMRDLLGLDGVNESAVPAASDSVIFSGVNQVIAIVGMYFPAPVLFLGSTQLAKFVFNALQRRYTQRFSSVELCITDLGCSRISAVSFDNVLWLFVDNFVDHRYPLRHHEIEVYLKLFYRFGLCLAAW